jgi:hypothetical protein
MSPYRHRSLRHRRCVYVLRLMCDFLWVATVTHFVLRVQGDWIDPDTPQQYYSTQPLTSGDHRNYRLVRGCKIDHTAVIGAPVSRNWFFRFFQMNSIKMEERLWMDTILDGMLSKRMIVRFLLVECVLQRLCV